MQVKRGSKPIDPTLASYSREQNLSQIYLNIYPTSPNQTTSSFSNTPLAIAIDHPNYSKLSFKSSTLPYFDNPKPLVQPF